MICKGCGTVFCWDYAGEGTLAGNRRLYCSEPCRKRAAPSGRRRHNKRGRLRSCRERDKQRYGNYDHAARAAKLIWGSSGDLLRPYKCPCGYWHLTSKPRDEDGAP